MRPLALPTEARWPLRVQAAVQAQQQAGASRSSTLSFRGRCPTQAAQAVGQALLLLLLLLLKLLRLLGTCRPRTPYSPRPCRRAAALRVQLLWGALLGDRLCMMWLDLRDLAFLPPLLMPAMLQLQEVDCTTLLQTAWLH